MVIDIRTLIFLTGLIHFLEVLMFVHQNIANKRAMGPGWWLMWSGAKFSALMLMLFRGVPDLISIVITLQNPIILLSVIFMYIGVLRFFDLKVSWKLIIYIFGSFLVLHLFFQYVIDVIKIRALIINLYLLSVSILTIVCLIKKQDKCDCYVCKFQYSIIIFKYMLHYLPD